MRLAPSGQREIERLLVVIGADGHVGAGIDQSAGGLEIAVLRRGMQRRPSAVLAGICVRAMIEQELDDVGVLARGGRMQGRVFHLIRGSRGHGCAFIQQRRARRRPFRKMPPDAAASSRRC